MKSGKKLTDEERARLVEEAIRLYQQIETETCDSKFAAALEALDDLGIDQFHQKMGITGEDNHAWLTWMEGVFRAFRGRPNIELLQALEKKRPPNKDLN